MKIYLDADGIPYRGLTIERARLYGVGVVLVTDYSHYIPPENGVEMVLVDEGRDAADFAIVNRVQDGDLVVTQDVGLASLILPKGAAVISPRGYEFTEESIEGQLARRWLAHKIRIAGGRTRGPKAFSEEDRDRFLSLLETKLIMWTRSADEDR